jgi:hypothetical protein
VGLQKNILTALDQFDGGVAFNHRGEPIKVQLKAKFGDRV